jgi:3-dehydroshikimate dehydratase
MFQTGLVSITFRQLLPVQVVELVAQAQLQAIEWGGDVHVPHGNLQVARDVQTLTRNAGLAVAAYGSYYRVGHSESEGDSFQAVLDTALALGAPVIRVWAGKKDSGEADHNYRRLVTEDLQRICDMAAQAGVTVATEFHRGTLTDTAASARQLLLETEHPNVKTLWQPRVNARIPEAMADLERVLPWLAHIHVFQWRGTQRRALAEGDEAWALYLGLADDVALVRSALIEFVRNDDPQQFLHDAQTLRRWCGQFPEPHR